VGGRGRWKRPFDFPILIIGGLLLFVLLILVIPIIIEFAYTHTVPRFPTLILAVALGILGFLSFTIGPVLRTVTKGPREAKHLAYLTIPAPEKR
jgi:hypothetical protein